MTKEESTYDERVNCIRASLLLINAALEANREGRRDDVILLDRVRARVDERTNEVSMNTGDNGGQYHVYSFPSTLCNG